MNTSLLAEALSGAQSALQLIATPVRPDGTYNRDRRSCELLAKEALQKIESILNEKETTQPLTQEVKRKIRDIVLLAKGEKTRESGAAELSDSGLQNEFYFTKPSHLAEFSKNLLEECGKCNMEVKFSSAWQWKDIVFLGKSIRAASFFVKAVIFPSQTPLLESFSCRSSICVINNPLVEIQDLNSLFKAFSVDCDYKWYKWDDSGFVLSCRNANAVRKLQSQITKHFNDFVDSYEVDAKKMELRVLLRENPQ